MSHIEKEIPPRPSEKYGELNKSRPQSGQTTFWFIVATSSLFIILIMMQSLQHGKLSVPVTYDDIGYFNDGASRLEIFYQHGIVALLLNLFRILPHAPIATFSAFTGFAIFGIRDWAPTVVNVVWVALLLVFVRVLVRDIPRWAYFAIALSVLAWPWAGSLVIESRPDLYASLLTVMGCTLMLRSSLLQASARHIAIVAALFGGALIAKPSISPITLTLYCVSLAISAIIDGVLSFKLEIVRKSALRILQCLGVTTILVLPYYAFAWHDVYAYIYLALVTQKNIWALHLTPFDTVGYYIWGSGGQPMIGRWLPVTIIAVITDSALFLIINRSINWRSVGIYAVFILAYILVTIPATKTPYLGVIVPTFLLTLYVLASGGIISCISRLPHYGKGAAIICACMLLTISALFFRWPWWWGEGALSDHFVATKRFEIIQKVGDYLESHAHDSHDEVVVFSDITQFFNGPILQFELQKRQLGEIRVIDFVNSEGVRKTLSVSDYIVEFDEADPEIYHWAPGNALRSELKAMVVNDPAFQPALTIPTADGDYTITLYARKHLLHIAPFRHLLPVSGFMSLEGPYPKWNLPQVRWATGTAASARFLNAAIGLSYLTLRARSPLAGQNIKVTFQGQPIGACDLPKPDVFVDCAFPVTVSDRTSLVAFRFAKSGSPQNGMRSVLFSALHLEPKN